MLKLACECPVVPLNRSSLVASKYQSRTSFRSLGFSDGPFRGDGDCGGGVGCCTCVGSLVCRSSAVSARSGSRTRPACASVITHLAQSRVVSASCLSCSSCLGQKRGQKRGKWSVRPVTGPLFPPAQSCRIAAMLLPSSRRIIAWCSVLTLWCSGWNFAYKLCSVPRFHSPFFLNHPSIALALALSG